MPPVVSPLKDDTRTALKRKLIRDFFFVKKNAIKLPQLTTANDFSVIRQVLFPRRLSAM